MNVGLERMSEVMEPANVVCAEFSIDRKLRVLHVDDDLEFLAVAKQVLEDQGGFQVDDVSSAEEALGKAGESEYDAVVADYQMPGMNGLELLRELRHRGNDVPFILFSCKAKEEIAIEALNSGVERFITKHGNIEASYAELEKSILNAARRKENERLLKKAESCLRLITANMQDMLLLTDKNLTITFASCSIRWILGYEPDDVVGKSVFEFVHPDDVTTASEFAKKAFENCCDAKIDMRCRRADGSYAFVEVIGKVLTDENGEIIGTVISSRDITERRKMEQSLRESEERYRRLFDEALDAIFVADAETGTLVDCNRAATELVGRSKSEIIGLHQRFLHPGKGSEAFTDCFRQHVGKKEGQIIEDQIITKQGEIRDVAIKGNVIEINAKKLIKGIFRDITESKKSLEKTSFQSRLLNAVGQAVIAADTNGTITYWNKAAEQLYGWSETEMLGTNIMTTVLKDVAQENMAEVGSHFADGESWIGETTLRRKDGDFVQVIISTSPITNESGELAGIVGVSTDVTEQRWMREVLEDAVKKVAELNEKLRVVESLTRHDIRNKLSAVNGRVFLLKKRLSENAEALSQLKELEFATQQMLSILEFERLYVRVGSEELNYVDVEKHLSEAVSLFSDLKGVQLVKECYGLTVLADSLLRQMFYNLIDNTLKYGETVRKIRVHFKEEKDQLKLIYEDDGVGVSDEMRSSLFTEGFGKGTGYGLYLIKRICEAYGWTIEETGKRGQGAQFTMTIPKGEKEGKKTYEIS